MRIHALILLAGTLVLPASAATRADFSGDWIAVDAATPAVDKAGDRTQAPAHAGGRGGGRGMGGHGGGHANRGVAGAGTAGASYDSTFPRLRAHALLIRQSDDVFDVEADGGRLAYRFDGKHNYGPVYGGTVNLTWAEPEMVIETHPDSGGSIEERYRLSADGKKLTLNVRQQDAAQDEAHEQTRNFVRNGDEPANGVALP